VKLLSSLSLSLLCYLLPLVPTNLSAGYSMQGLAVRFDEINKMLRSEQFFEANKELDDVLRQYSHMPRALHLKGQIAFAQNNYPQAVAFFTEVIVQRPERAARSYYSRGVSYLAMHQDEKAYIDIRKALEIDPSLLELLKDKSQLYQIVNGHPMPASKSKVKKKEIAENRSNFIVKTKRGIVKTKKGSIILKKRGK
jgi:tetratricopeptide (TPR) repeat protein